MKLNTLLTDKNLSEIFSKSLIFFVFKVGGFGFGYLFTILITRSYGKDIYGLYSIAFTLFIILAVISKFGFDINITRLTSSSKYSKDEIRKLYFKIVVTSFTLAIIIAIIVIYFSGFISFKIFDNPSLEDYIIWAAYSFPLWSIILINAGVFRGFKKNTLFSIFGSFGRFTLVSCILLIYFITTDENIPLAPMIIHFIVVLILVMSSTIIILKMFSQDDQIETEKIKPSSFFSDSLPIFMSSVIFILLGWVDRIFLGIFDSEANVALFDVAAKVALLIGFGLEALNSILAPKVSELYYTSKLTQLQKSINFTAFINSAIALLIFIILVLFPETILSFFGNEFKEAKMLLIILAIGQLFNCLSGSVGVILQMTGYQRTYRLIMFYALLLNLTLNLLLVKPYGALGVALSTTLSMIAWNILGVIYIKKKLNLLSFYFPSNFKK